MITLSFTNIMNAVNVSNAIASIIVVDECYIVRFVGHQSDANKRAFCKAIEDDVRIAVENKKPNHTISRYEDVNILVEENGVYEYPIAQYGFNEDDELEVDIAAWMSNFRGKSFQVSRTIDGDWDMGSSDPVDFAEVPDHLKRTVLAGQHDSALLRFSGTSYYDDGCSIASTMVFMQHGMRDIIIGAIINHKN